MKTQGVTITWSRRGHLVVLHRQPVVARGLLLLELPLEGGGEVSESEGADRGAGDGVGRGPEHGVHHTVHLVPVAPLQHTQ